MNNTTVNSTLNELNAHFTTWRVDISIGILLYIIALVTMLGNALVLVAVFLNKKLQTNFNFYVVNLAVTDFAVGMTGMMLHTTEMILGYWPFGGAICAIWVFLDYVLPLNLCSRYFWFLLTDYGALLGVNTIADFTLDTARGNVLSLLHVVGK